MANLTETLEASITEVELKLKNKVASIPPERLTDSHTVGSINNARAKILEFKADVKVSLNLHSGNPYMYEYIMADKKKKIEGIEWSIDQIK